MKVKKGSVQIDSDRCKGCGLCISVCPLELLEQNGNEVNIKGYHPSVLTDETKCIGCGQCALMCPDSVLTVKRFLRQGRKQHA